MVLSRYKVITYMSAACLWGEKGMERGGCLWNCDLWKERWMLCLLRNNPLFFRIPSTNLDLFFIISLPHKVYELLIHTLHTTSLEKHFFTLYSHLSDNFYFFHMCYPVCFLSPSPCCCHRKQRLMKRQQNFSLQWLHPWSAKSSSEIQTANWRGVSLQEQQNPES